MNSGTPKEEHGSPSLPSGADELRERSSNGAQAPEPALSPHHPASGTDGDDSSGANGGRARRRPRRRFITH